MKRHWRDSYDRVYLKDLDAVHVMLPILTPNRCDNEAVSIEVIDIEAISKYIDEKNANSPDFKYTWFQVILAAMAKVLILRPKMNRFILERRVYANREVKLAFLVKKAFEDDAEESLAKMTVNPDGGSLIEQVHSYVQKFVTTVRKERLETSAGNFYNALNKLPIFLIRLIFWLIRKLDSLGLCPKSIAENDPCHSSIFVSNLGSIGLNAEYHHLFEGGTMSMFAVIGTKKKRPFFNSDGTYEMRDTIKLSLTIDERIADGIYFGNSLKLLRYLFLHPELLDQKADFPVCVE